MGNTTAIKNKSTKGNFIKYSLIGTGIAAGIGLVVWAKNKQNLGNKIAFGQDVSIKVTQRGLFGIPTKINVIVTPKISNPTYVKATLTQPYVEVRFEKDAPIPFLKSDKSNKTFDIPAADKATGAPGVVTLSPIIFPVVISDALQKTSDLLKGAIKARKIPVYIRVQTSLETALIRIPKTIEQEKDITF